MKPKGVGQKRTSGRPVKNIMEPINATPEQLAR